MKMFKKDFKKYYKIFSGKVKFLYSYSTRVYNYKAMKKSKNVEIESYSNKFFTIEKGQ